MGDLQGLLESHGLMLVFLNVLAEQAGLPVPAYPMLFVAGALGMQDGGPSIGAVLAAVIAACLIADTARYGWPAPRATDAAYRLPRVDLARQLYPPDPVGLSQAGAALAAVRQAAARRRRAVHGHSRHDRHAYPLFLFYDALGSLVWAGGALLVGVVFSDFVDAILHAFSTYGHLAVLAALALFALFLARRWWRRVHLLRRTRRIPRMTVDELESAAATACCRWCWTCARRQRRSSASRAQVVDTDSALQMLASHPATAEIVTYCACPNEVSAAIRRNG